MTGQTLLIMLGALLLMLSTIRLVRMRLLSISYGIGWLSLATIGLLGSPLLTVITQRLDVLGFTPTGFSLGIFVVFLGLIALQLSISLSGLQRATQDIAEHASHVEARLRRLERAAEQADAAAPAASEAPGHEVAR